MKITKLHIENFKNIKSANIKFRDINAIIGQNGAGKTNIISAIKFLRFYLRHGHKDALNAVGGGKNLFSQFYLNPRQLKVELVCEPTKPVQASAYFGDNKLISHSILLELTPTKDSANLDTIRQKVSYVLSSEDKNIEVVLDIKIKAGAEKDGNQSDFEFKVFQSGILMSKNEQEIFLDKSGFYFKMIKSFFDTTLQGMGKTKAEQLDAINQFFISSDGYITGVSFDEIEMYSFDPTLSKKPSEIGYNNLSFNEQGENFSNMLKRFSPNMKKEYLLTLQAFFPQIDDYEITPTPSQHEIVIFHEKYGNNIIKTNFSSISDGMAIIALIIAAVKQRVGGMLIVEEPERFIHPGIISRLMNFFKQEASSTQIVLTTHSPIVVNEVSINELIFVEKTEDGGSITRSAKNIPHELLEDLGLGDLYANSIL